MGNCHSVHEENARRPGNALGRNFYQRCQNESSISACDDEVRDFDFVQPTKKKPGFLKRLRNRFRKRESSVQTPVAPPCFTSLEDLGSPSDLTPSTDAECVTSQQPTRHAHTDAVDLNCDTILSTHDDFIHTSYRNGRCTTYGNVALIPYDDTPVPSENVTPVPHDDVALVPYDVTPVPSEEFTPVRHDGVTLVPYDVTPVPSEEFTHVPHDGVTLVPYDVTPVPSEEFTPVPHDGVTLVPYDVTPVPSEEFTPVPHDGVALVPYDVTPVPSEEFTPVPHDGVALVPYDVTPVPSEEFTPVPHDGVALVPYDVTPVPSEEFTPVPHDGVALVPYDVTPVPSEEFTPVPHDGVTLVPYDVTPVPSEDFTPVPHNDVTHVPHDGISPVSCDDGTTVSHDDATPVPSKDVSPVPCDDLTLVSHYGATPAPSEDDSYVYEDVAYGQKVPISNTDGAHVACQNKVGCSYRKGGTDASETDLRPSLKNDSAEEREQRPIISDNLKKDPPGTSVPRRKGDLNEREAPKVPGKPTKKNVFTDLVGKFCIWKKKDPPDRVVNPRPTLEQRPKILTNILGNGASFHGEQYVDDRRHNVLFGPELGGQHSSARKAITQALYGHSPFPRDDGLSSYQQGNAGYRSFQNQAARRGQCLEDSGRRAQANDGHLKRIEDWSRRFQTVGLGRDQHDVIDKGRDHLREGACKGRYQEDSRARSHREPRDASDSRNEKVSDCHANQVSGCKRSSPTQFDDRGDIGYDQRHQPFDDRGGYDQQEGTDCRRLDGGGGSNDIGYKNGRFGFDKGSGYKNPADNSFDRYEPFDDGGGHRKQVGENRQGYHESFYNKDGRFKPPDDEGGHFKAKDNERRGNQRNGDCKMYDQQQNNEDDWNQNGNSRVHYSQMDYRNGLDCGSGRFIQTDDGNIRIRHTDDGRDRDDGNSCYRQTDDGRVRDDGNRRCKQTIDLYNRRNDRDFYDNGAHRRQIEDGIGNCSKTEGRRGHDDGRNKTDSGGGRRQTVDRLGQVNEDSRRRQCDDVGGYFRQSVRDERLDHSIPGSRRAYVDADGRCNQQGNDGDNHVAFGSTDSLQDDEHLTDKNVSAKISNSKNDNYEISQSAMQYPPVESKKYGSLEHMKMLKLQNQAKNIRLTQVQTKVAQTWQTPRRNYSYSLSNENKEVDDGHSYDAPGSNNQHDAFGGYHQNDTGGCYRQNDTGGGYHQNDTDGGYRWNDTGGGYRPNDTGGGYRQNDTGGGYHQNDTGSGYRQQINNGNRYLEREADIGDRHEQFDDDDDTECLQSEENWAEQRNNSKDFNNRIYHDEGFQYESKQATMHYPPVETKKYGSFEHMKMIKLQNQAKNRRLKQVQTKVAQTWQTPRKNYSYSLTNDYQISQNPDNNNYGTVSHNISIHQNNSKRNRNIENVHSKINTSNTNAAKLASTAMRRPQGPPLSKGLPQGPFRRPELNNKSSPWNRNTGTCGAQTKSAKGNQTTAKKRKPIQAMTSSGLIYNTYTYV